MTMLAQEVDEHVWAGVVAASKQVMVIGMPDVTEEEMDAIFAKPRVWYGERDEDGPDELHYQTTRGQYL